ncbi:MAG: glycosyltransferase family 39 protein [Casimicrobiaceae bacterium]
MRTPDVVIFPWRRAVAWAPFVLLSANALVTAWVVFHLHPMETAIYSDMRNYLVRAWEIDQGRFDPRHFFQPIGYTLWIAAAQRLAGGGFWLLKASHVVLVSMSVYLGWRTARRLLPGRWDLAALALLSANVQWWALAGFALSETLYTFLVTLLLWTAVRWAQAPTKLLAAAVGLAFAAGFYVKGSAVLFPLLLAAWTLVRSFADRPALRRGIAHLAIMGAAAATIALSHGVFAHAKYGHFKLGADAGGLNFVEGKCPSKLNIDSEGTTWHSPLFTYLGEHERKVWRVPFSDQAFFWREGLHCVRENPAVLVTSLRYVYYLFAGNPLWPVEFPNRHLAEQVYESLIPTAIVPLLVISLLATLIRWRTALAVPALLYASLFFSVWMFKGELRFRIPFDAVTMIFASFGAATAWQFFVRARRRGQRQITGA